MGTGKLSGIYDQDVIEEILDDIRIFLAFAGINPKQNIFDQINDIIIDNLKTGSVFSGSLKSKLKVKDSKIKKSKAEYREYTRLLAAKAVKKCT
jgi:hypothetical protein